MNFYDAYQQSAKSNKMADMEFNPQLLIPNTYKYAENDHMQDNYQSSVDFLHLLAGGNVMDNQIFSFSFLPIDCHVILYTYSGGGRICAAGKNITLTEKSLIFFDCSQKFSLQSMVLPWNFKLFFIQGQNLNLYKPILSFPDKCIFSIPEHSPILRDFSELISIPCNYTMQDLIKMHRLLTDILCLLAMSSKTKSEVLPENIPPYLYEMKDHIDNHFAEPFSLDSCEETLNISKYRLCREFSKYFGDSPAHYLKTIRLNKAKEMLLTTDLNIHEISSLVGYENVNHFINLFKKDTAVTPNAYRLKAVSAMPVALSARTAEQSEQDIKSRD